MNYFELFDIPVQLKVDTASLTNKYFELSKKYHPDYFANAGSDEQAEALEKSAQLNRALKTLRDEDETIKYVLQLKGLQEEEEKYQLPPAFLMEMMEVNEQLMDARMEEDNDKLQKLQSVIDNFETEMYAPVKDIVEHYQEGVTTEKELLQVKEYYYKKKYLQRIKQQMKE